MTLTAPSSGPIGQGVRTTINCDTFATGDYVTLALVEVSSGRDPCDSTFLVDGAGNASGPLGVDQLHGGVLLPVLNGCAPGVAVRLDLIRWNAAGSIQEFGGATGFTYDGVSGIHALLGGGGLTPPQADLLDTINANTQAGAFKFPFIGVTTTVAVAESPVSGSSVVDLTVPSIPGVQVVGLTWDATTIPDVGVGTVGVVQEASRRVIQAVIFHSLAGGVTFADQVVDSNHVTGAFFFDSWDPTGVAIYVWPAFVLDVSWLLFP